MSDSHRRGEPLAKVGIQVLGLADRIEPARLAVINELPAFMQAEGIEADLYFREPGGMGLPPLEVVTVFLAGVGVKLMGDLLKDAAQASIKGAIAWARERIRRQPNDSEPPSDRPVVVILYGPRGERLCEIEVTEHVVNDRYVHPSIRDEGSATSK